MIYRRFQDKDLSLLGFGAMRLPLLEDKSIDQEELNDMVKYALEHGINYFDTAYPYHGGKSEIALGEALKAFPRESFYLADKFPGHQPVEKWDVEGVFKEQLDKCQVEYFDFYLLHNISEFSIDTYLDDELGFVDYFVEQKKQGKIRHLGFSAHADLDCLKRFVDKYGDVMEFCQIQLNYVDYTLQHAKEKYEYLTEKGIPVWVMEPLRGGKLKNTAESFRWLQRFDNVKMILSGMSNMDQMRENCAIFHADDPLSDLDTNGFKLLADKFVKRVPCTGCHYCDGCPMGINIPLLLDITNDARTGFSFTVTMKLEGQPEGSRPADCIGCGACVEKCPQKIDIPGTLKELDQLWQGMPKWIEVCKQREEAAKKLREGK